MILYVGLGLFLIVAGFAVIFLSTHYDWPIYPIVLIAPLLFLGYGLCMCATLRSGIHIETSTVTKVTIEEAERSLEMANGDIVECLPDQQACLDAKIGDLVVYSTKWHDSGLWVEKREAIMILHPDQ